MHTQSGLLDAIGESTITLEEAGKATLEFFQAAPPRGRHGAALRQLDRARTGASSPPGCPDLDEYLHYRSVDVSTVKELVRRWYPDAYADAPKKAGGHRALDDIKESVAELAYYRQTVFKPAD